MSCTGCMPSRRRSVEPDLQRELGRRVALYQIAATAPKLSQEDAELAWRFGFRPELDGGELAAGRGGVRRAPARLHGLGALRRRRATSRCVGLPRGRSHVVPGSPAERSRAHLGRRALALDPALPVHVAARRARRARAGRRARDVARRRCALARRVSTPRSTSRSFCPEPTPYRTGMLDRLSARPELDLTVVYAATRGPAAGVGHRRAVTARWSPTASASRAPRACSGTTTHCRSASSGALRDADPDVVVVSGWSTFASQATVAWCTAPRRPVRAPRRVQRAGRAARVAADGEERGRADGGRRRGRDARRRLPRPRLDARTGRPRRPDLGRRQHGRCRPLRPRGGRARLASRHAPRGCRYRGRRCRRALRCAPRTREGPRHARARRQPSAGEPAARGCSWRGPGPERESLALLAAELGVRLVLLPDTPWERIVERYVRRRRVRAPLAPRAVGRRRQRGRGVRAAARPLRSGRCRLRPARGRPERPARTGRRRRGRGRGAPRARGRPEAAPRDGRGLAGDRRPAGATSRASTGSYASCGASPGVSPRAPRRRARAARRRRRPTSTRRGAGALLPRAARRSASSPRTRATASTVASGSYGTTSASPSARTTTRSPSGRTRSPPCPTDAASAATSPKFSPPEARTNTSARR